MGAQIGHDPASAPRTIKVWDPFVRVFHWALVASFACAYLLGDDGGDWHQMFGYTALGLVAARIVWGLVGSGPARFSAFVPSPRRLARYLRDLLAGREERYLGHNPAGAMMILALLSGVVALGLSGWMLGSDAFWGAKWLEELHEGIAATTLGLVAIHVAGVAFASYRHRENLVRAMITGRKRP